METTIKDLDDVRRVYFKYIHARGCPTVIAIHEGLTRRSPRVSSRLASRDPINFASPRDGRRSLPSAAKKGHEVIKILVPTRSTSTGRE